MQPFPLANKFIEKNWLYLGKNEVKFGRKQSDLSEISAKLLV